MATGADADEQATEGPAAASNAGTSVQQPVTVGDAETSGNKITLGKAQL